MKIALAQVNICWENTEENFEICNKYIKRASENEVDLIVFPEMVLTGFTMNINSLKLSEEYILNYFKEKAINNNINIAFGYGVKVNEKGENKFAIISSKGEVKGIYTKIHPFSYSGEDKIFNKGNKIISINIDNVMVTPFICYDLRFPEIFQIASKESQLIIIIASWPKEREEHWNILLRARAIENQCFIVGVNRVGEGDNIVYSGGSLILDPLGNNINKQSNKECLIIEDIDISLVNKVRGNITIKKDRREKFYKESEVIIV